MKKNLILLISLFILLIPFKVDALSYKVFDDVGIVDENVDGIQFNPEDTRLEYNSLCSNDGIRQSVKIIGYVLEICKWVVPFIIIILGMIDFFKATMANDEKAVSKATSSLIKRFIAGIVVIFVPTIIMAILNAIKVTNGLENTEFGECTTCLFKPSECKKGVAIKQPTNGGATTTGTSSVTGGSSSNNNNKVIKTTYFKTYYLENQKCPIYYGYETTPRRRLNFDAAKGDELLSILNRVCDYVASNPYIDKIQDAGFGVNRPDGGADYHAKGLAFDLNNKYVYVDPETGKKYNPYGGQGANWWSRYKTFICEVCNGNENCDKNVNYQIYNRYFKPKGWCWGGSWSPKSFDPMHIEYSNNCGNREKVTCD